MPQDNNGKVLKLIGLLFTGVMLVAAGVGAHFQAISQSRDYTDKKVTEAQEHQNIVEAESRQEMAIIREQSTQIDKKVTIIHTLLEERWGKKK